MFRKKLYNIIREIDSFKSREEVMKECVAERLERSLNIYTKELEMACNYLLSRSSIKVLNNINRRDDM